MVFEEKWNSAGVPLPETLPHIPTYKSRRSEEHTSELQSQSNLVCRLLLEKKKQHHHNLPDRRHAHRHALYRISPPQQDLCRLHIGCIVGDSNIIAHTVQDLTTTTLTARVA